MNSTKRATLRQGAILWLLGVVGAVAVLPYAFSLQADAIRARLEAGLTLPALAALAAVQTAVLVAIAVALGLLAARRVGLRAPVTEALARREPALPIVRGFAAPALALGAAAGVLVIALDALLFMPRIPALQDLARASLARIELWQAALASLYGGITEEILIRLFLMSVLALGLRAIARSKRAPPPPAVMWGAILLAALLFGLGHLPATAAAQVPLDGLVISRALILNGLVGVPAGWLFWRYGLEAGMLAHWTADILLHVVAPALSRAGALPL